MSDKIKIITVTGPTASGKTALAIELAKRYDGEIISCDSMQIYKGMDIGTAKPTKDELAAVPHHLIDILPADAPYSCSDYVKDAEAAVEDIVSRGKLPIFCGGTGLYLDRLLKGFPRWQCGKEPACQQWRHRRCGFNSWVKNPPASTGDIRDTDSIPGQGRSPGGGHGKIHSSILA